MAGNSAKPDSDIHVECYAGYRADQEPRAFTLDHRRHTIATVDRRWRTPQADLFEVTTVEGFRCVLEHEPTRDIWRVVSIAATST